MMNLLQPAQAAPVAAMAAAAGWGRGVSAGGFLAGRLVVSGTGLLTRLIPMVRAASRWLSARTLERPVFFVGNATQGTAERFQHTTDARSAPGWLAARRPGTLMAGNKACQGTGSLAPFETKARAASRWLSARALFQATDLQAYDYHLPIFPDECAHWMEAGEGKFIIDGTLGGGGHSEIFLKSGARVLGIDRDPEALAHARTRLAEHGERFSTWEGNFADVQNAPALMGGEKADGFLLDLGVSSRQLDSASRGFSFMREGPLDMRMGPSSPRSAADILHGWSESELIRIFREYGEEPRARRIASAIVERRVKQAFSTTTELADFIERVIGKHGRTHPATRVFQAVRMAVNEELDALSSVLRAVPQVLKPGGRLLIITFHSLEDRMVKRFLRHRASPFIDERGWPEPRPNPDHQFDLPVRKAILPTPDETSRNPRARSAKLRVARLLDHTP